MSSKKDAKPPMFKVTKPSGKHVKIISSFVEQLKKQPELLDVYCTEIQTTHMAVDLRQGSMGPSVPFASPLSKDMACVSDFPVDEEYTLGFGGSTRFGVLEEALYIEVPVGFAILEQYFVQAFRNDWEIQNQHVICHYLLEFVIDVEALRTIIKDKYEFDIDELRNAMSDNACLQMIDELFRPILNPRAATLAWPIWRNFVVSTLAQMGVEPPVLQILIPDELTRQDE